MSLRIEGEVIMKSFTNFTVHGREKRQSIRVTVPVDILRKISELIQHDVVKSINELRKQGRHYPATIMLIIDKNTEKPYIIIEVNKYE